MIAITALVCGVQAATVWGECPKDLKYVADFKSQDFQGTWFEQWR